MSNCTTLARYSLLDLGQQSGTVRPGWSYSLQFPARSMNRTLKFFVQLRTANSIWMFFHGERLSA